MSMNKNHSINLVDSTFENVYDNVNELLNQYVGNFNYTSTLGPDAHKGLTAHKLKFRIFERSHDFLLRIEENDNIHLLISSDKEDYLREALSILKTKFILK